MSVTLNNQEFFVLIVSAVRYAMGRATYVVGETCDIVKKHLAVLTPEQKQMLARDIEDEIKRAEREGKILGMSLDHAEWSNLVIALRASCLPSPSSPPPRPRKRSSVKMPAVKKSKCGVSDGKYGWICEEDAGHDQKTKPHRWGGHSWYS